ncbi:hypothetical protein [Nocardia sp. NPDC020380]|uniref:hypothetical protein n=1 Tax=Nocardia sp. NPDC020380 TaxID=3364309 RepID=UPI0037AC5645
MVPVLVILIGFFGPLTLMFLRWRRIRRYGANGGEFNNPLAAVGYGGVPPGTAIQENFGGVTTVQTQAATGTSAGLLPGTERVRRVEENSKPAPLDEGDR